MTNKNIPQKEPLVSIIIPVKNGDKYIRKCLKSINQQTYKNIEVLIIDGGSTDKTLDIAKEFKAKIYKTKNGRSYQKNFGASKAKGKYLYFVDCDFYLDKNIVKEAVHLLENNEADMVEVHNTSDPKVSFWSKVRKFERDMFINDEYTISPRFIPKDIFWSVKGFDEHLIAAEDYEIYNRFKEKGYKLGFTKYFEIHLDEPKTFKEILKKHYFYGRTVTQTKISLFKSLVKKQKKSQPKLTFWQRSPIKPCHIKNGYKLLTHPILGTGLLIYQTGRYFAGLIGWVVGKGIKEETPDRTFHCR